LREVVEVSFDKRPGVCHDHTHCSRAFVCYFIPEKSSIDIRDEWERYEFSFQFFIEHKIKFDL